MKVEWESHDRSGGDYLESDTWDDTSLNLVSTWCTGHADKLVMSMKQTACMEIFAWWV